MQNCIAIPRHSISVFSVLHQQCDLPQVCQSLPSQSSPWSGYMRWRSWGKSENNNEISFILKGGEKYPMCIACAQDFIWLHDVIQENLQYAGFIIPPKVRMAFITEWFIDVLIETKGTANESCLRLTCCPFEFNVFKNLSFSHPTLTSTPQGKNCR